MVRKENARSGPHPPSLTGHEEDWHPWVSPPSAALVSLVKQHTYDLSKRSILYPGVSRSSFIYILIQIGVNYGKYC